jgi:hypothetical protein
MGCRLLTRTGPGRQSVGRRPTIRELAGCKEVKITTCPDPGLVQHPITHIYTDLGGNIAFTMLFFWCSTVWAIRSKVDKSHALAFTLVTCHPSPGRCPTWETQDRDGQTSPMAVFSSHCCCCLFSLVATCPITQVGAIILHTRRPLPSLYPRTRGRCSGSSVYASSAPGSDWRREPFLTTPLEDVTMLVQYGLISLSFFVFRPLLSCLFVVETYNLQASTWFRIE